VLLPNAERAIIDQAKLHDYVLWTSHPWGVSRRGSSRHSASRPTTGDLEAALRAQHLTQPAVAEPVEVLGQPFTIRAILKRPASSALVTSVWFLRTGEQAARFVTAYPGGKA
jgi:hypothetical protein